MKINEVSQRVGISISSLHYYENIGLISPNRESNNYRDYSEKDVEWLKLIIIMKNYDFSIKEIGDVIKRSSNIDQKEEVLEEARLLKNGSIPIVFFFRDKKIRFQSPK